MNPEVDVRMHAARRHPSVLLPPVATAATTMHMRPCMWASPVAVTMHAACASGVRLTTLVPGAAGHGMAPSDLAHVHW